jgi:aminopeptidase C
MQKTLSDVYEVLKLSRSMSTSNSHPLSSMLNRNLRVFEQIKYQTGKEISKQIAQHESKNNFQQTFNFNESDFKRYDISNRIVVMGLEDP